MATERKVAIVTGASQGIGAGVLTALLCRGYQVVANALDFSNSGMEASDRLALVEGSIADAATADRIADVAVTRFGAIDALVNNAGILLSRPFTEYTLEDLRSHLAVNVEGFFLISQLAVRRMLAQKRGGSIVTVTASLADHPILGSNASVPMLTKGGLQAITLSLAMEYAQRGIRVNAVAPGVVDTPMHKDQSKELLRARQPMGRIAEVSDITDAIVYLMEAGQVTGEVLHVDGGAHVGKW